MQKKDKTYITTSCEETGQVAQQFARSLTAPAIVAFCGDLGSGKTTFIRSLAISLGVEEREVCSPTFVYLNIYHGNMTIYHFDLYRLRSSQEFLEAGFNEFLQSEGICCIEWSEKITDLLSEDIRRVAITTINQNSRTIVIS